MSSGLRRRDFVWVEPHQLDAMIRFRISRGRSGHQQDALRRDASTGYEARYLILPGFFITHINGVHTVGKSESLTNRRVATRRDDPDPRLGA
jgi:hypothetical protein